MRLADILAPVLVCVRQTVQQAGDTPAAAPAPVAAPTPFPFDATPPGSQALGSQAPATTHDGADAAASALAADLDAAIHAARTQALEAGIAASDIDDALFAISAWADEALRAAAWPGARRWHRHLMQQRYFGTTTAGVEFFTRLAALPAGAHDVREVYALCMALGFAGRYEYERDPQTLRQIRTQTLQRLLVGRGDQGGRAAMLFPEAYAGDDGEAADATRPASRRWALGMSSFTAGFVALPLVLLLVLGLAYYLVLGQMAANIEAMIR